MLWRTETHTTHPMQNKTSCSTLIAAYILSTVISALLFWWYAGLWQSAIGFPFWTRSLPFAAIVTPFVLLIAHGESTPVQALQKLVLGLLLLGSVIAQALVWVGILKAPIF